MKKKGSRGVEKKQRCERKEITCPEGCGRSIQSQNNNLLALSIIQCLAMCILCSAPRSSPSSYIICGAYRFGIRQIPSRAVVVNAFQEFPAVGVGRDGGRRIAVRHAACPARDDFFANVVIHGNRAHAEADLRLVMQNFKNKIEGQMRKCKRLRDLDRCAPFHLIRSLENLETWPSHANASLK